MQVVGSSRQKRKFPKLSRGSEDGVGALRRPGKVGQVARRAPQVPAPAPDLEREVIHLREQVAQLQEDRTIQPVVKKQAIGRPVSSRRDGHGRIPLMPRLVPNDVTIWLQDRQADYQEALAQGDFRSLPELCKLMSEGVDHLLALFPTQPSTVANMVVS